MYWEGFTTCDVNITGFTLSVLTQVVEDAIQTFFLVSTFCSCFVPRAKNESEPIWREAKTLITVYKIIVRLIQSIVAIFRHRGRNNFCRCPALVRQETIAIIAT